MGLLAAALLAVLPLDVTVASQLSGTTPAPLLAGLALLLYLREARIDGGGEARQ